MHTGFVPNPSVDHPSYGRRAHEMEKSLGGELGDSAVRVDWRAERGAGFLGMAYAPVSGRCEWKVANVGDERVTNSDG